MPMLIERVRRSMQRAPLLMLAACFCLLSLGARADAPRTGAYITSFTQTTPLAEQREVAERMLHRIVYEEDLAAGSLPAGQSVDPAKESWHVYVPEGYTGKEPYGVLVWVAPYDSGEIPYGWQGQLSDHKLIYVAADKSGNDQGVMDRRVPLALTGLVNIMAQYDVDKSRVYVGGFSGGGVTASRIAADYADVFTGGLFVSTSEGIGSENTPVPPLERYTGMKEHGRYVFTIGTEETNNQVMTGRAVDQYRSLCVLRVQFIHIPNRGHSDLEPRIFARALKYLDDPPAVDPADQAECDKELEARRGAAIDAVRQALAAGDKDKAHKLLLALHIAFGPLAEPEFSHYAACVNGNSAADDCKPAKGGGSI